MTSYSKLLKNILTTASTMAIVIGAASEAVAIAAIQGIPSPVAQTGGTIWNGNNTMFNSNDAMTLNDPDNSLVVNTVVNIDNMSLDVGPHNVQGSSIGILNSGSGSSIGSIWRAQGFNSMSLQVGDGTTFSLTGTNTTDVTRINDYSGLGAVTLGSTTGGTGTPSSLSITATGPITFTNTFDSYTGATANWGTLNISGANHIFNGVLGGTAKLGAINITDAHTVTFSNNVTATSINLGASTSGITLSGGTTTANIVNTSGGLNSTKVNINGGDATIAGSIGSSGMGISSLYFATDNILTMSGSRDIYAPITPYADGKGTLKLAGGTTTLHSPVGTFNVNTLLTALRSININNQTLVIDASANDLRIGGSITTTTGGSGTLTTQGSNQVLLYNDIGNGTAIGVFNVNANTTLFSGTVNTSAINIATGKRLTIDSTSGTRSITGAINGASHNVGNLVLTAASAGNSYNIVMNSAIGQLHPLNSLTISVPSTSTVSGGFPSTTSYATVSLNGNVSINGNIDMSSAGGAVSIVGITMISWNGNILTGVGTNSNASQSGTTISNSTINIPNGQMILGGNLILFSAPQITVSGGIVMNGYTISASGGGGPTINANLIGTGGGGTLSLGQSTTLAGSAGSASAPLTLITFINNGLVLTINATAASRSIYAPVNAGTTTLNVTGGNVTFFKDITLGSLNFVTDNTIGLDSTLGAVTVNAPITTYAAGKGTLTTSGSNTVTFNNDIASAAALAAINVNANTILYSGTVKATAITIASGKTLTIDSTSGSRSITGTIDGPSNNNGILTLQGSGSNHNIDIQSNVGSSFPLSSIAVTNASGSTITFHGNVAANGNIDASGAGSTVNFSGNVTSTIGNFLTSQSASSVMSGNVSVGGSVILGANASFAGGITAPSGIALGANTLTATGGTITGNLQTTGGSGTFAINGGNVTLAGSAGVSGNSLAAINFATDNTLIISGTRDIYAPITPSTNNIGTLKLSGGTTTLHSPVGTFNVNTLLTALHSININDQTLVIDASANDLRIGGSITTTTGGVGTLTTQGSNQVLLYNDIGNGTAIGTFNVNANTTLFSGTVNTSAINIASGKTLTIDSTSSSMSITGSIYGAGSPNVGALLLQGSHNIDINNAIGNVNPLSTVTVTNSSGSTVTFHGDVIANGNIDASGAGSTVNFGGTVTSTTGNFLTSQSVSSVMSGNVSVGGSVILGANASFAGGITAPSGIALGANTLTATGGTITGNITGAAGSIFNISTNAVTFLGNIGANGSAIGGINFATDTTLTISGGSSIYSPITASSTGRGLLKITGGNVTAFRDIGTSNNHVRQILITDNSVLSVNCNVYVNGIILNSDGATLKITGGSSGTPNVVSGTIYNTTATGGAARGLVFVGTGTAASYVNFAGGGGIGAGPNQSVQYLYIAGSATPPNASSAIISANSYFSTGGGVASGIVIGQNATLNVASGAALSFGGGTAINAEMVGSGTVILANATTVPVAIGGTTPPNTVRLSGFNNGTPSLLGNAIKATTLDLTGSAVVGLDSNATNITNFTSTDNHGYLYYNGTGSLTVNNIAVPLTLHSTGTLTASNATGGVIFNGNIGNTPTFIAANNASISDVTVLGVSGVGTFRTAGNATFTGSIGNSSYSLAALTLTGTSNNTVGITTATDIYATNVSHSNALLDIHTQNVVIHGNYLANNASLNLGAQKLTIDSGKTATFVGTLSVDATYAGGISQTVLDFSSATRLDVSAATILTFNIDNNSLMPHVNDVITVIKAPSTIILPTSSSLTISIGTSDPKWKVTAFGVLTYDSPDPVAVSSPAIQSPPTISALGFGAASSENIVQAVLKLGNTAQIDSNGVATFKTTIVQTLASANGVPSSRITLDLFGANVSPTSTQIVPVSIGSGGSANVASNIATYTQQFNDSEKKGWIGTFAETIVMKHDLDLTPSTNVAFGLIASQQELIPLTMANAIINPGSGGTPEELVDTMVKISAVDGADAANEMINRMGTVSQDSSYGSLAVIWGRQSFLSAPSAISSAPQVVVPAVSAPQGSIVKTPSITTNSILTGDEEVEIPGGDIQAAAYGIAAGSSAYDKYGVWMSLNVGKAKQKAFKGNSGFNSHSDGFTLGVDTMINERTSIGVTVSNTLNHVKYKDASTGNKTDSSSWVWAVYGDRQLKNDWFIRGTALFNRTHMNSKELRVVQGGHGIAQAKYNLISYGGEAYVGFAHRFKNDMILTPTIGFRVLHNNKSSYGQDGTTQQNNKISSDAMNNYSAVGGVSISKTFIKRDIAFMPEAHVNMQYGVNQKTPTGTFVSALTPNQTANFIGTKASQLTSTYGLSLTGSNEQFECGITGDVSVASKYVGYQGSLKFKVKF